MKRELVEILSRMDIPYNRKEDVGWLFRNLAVRNQFKPGFQRAMELLKEENKRLPSQQSNNIF